MNSMNDNQTQIANEQAIAEQLAANTEIGAQIISDFEAARKYMNDATLGFWQIYCAVNGIPLTGKVDDKRPYVADMTVASLVRSFPRYTIQKMPAMTAQVNRLKNGSHTVIANFLLRNNIINDNTFGKSLMSKIWLAAEYAITYGFCPAYTPFMKKGNTYGAPLQLVPYSDIAIEPNVFDANDARKYYVVNWWQKTQLKEKIATAKQNPDAGWLLDGLQFIYENASPTSRKGSDTTGTQDNDVVSANFTGYKIVSLFERGDADTPGKITMVEASTNTVIRQQPIASITGYPRIMFLVIDPDWQKPFGRSRAKLALPYHAINSTFLRSGAYMTEYNLNPTVIMKGMRGIQKVSLEPGGTIDAGDNPNAAVNPILLESQSLQEIQNTIKANSDQINSVFGQFGSEQGGVSKAPGWAGVAQKAQDVNTNFNRRFLEDFIREYAMNALDVIISNFQGQETLYLDDEALQDLKQNNIVDDSGLPLTESIHDENQFDIDWDVFRAGVHDINVIVDYGSSVDDDKQAQLQAKQSALDFMKSSGTLDSLDPLTRAKLVNNAVGDITNESTSDMSFDPQQAAAYQEQQQQLAAGGMGQTTQANAPGGQQQQ